MPGGSEDSGERRSATVECSAEFSELALKDRIDGADRARAEASSVGQPKFVERAARGVLECEAMHGGETRDRGAELTEPEAIAGEKECVLLGQPLHGDELERVPNPRGRIGGERCPLGVVHCFSSSQSGIVFVLHAHEATASLKFIVEPAHDGGEVAATFSNVVAMSVIAELTLGVLKNAERIASKRSNEGAEAAGHLVL